MKRHLKPVRIIILFLLMTAVFALSATTANAAAAPSQVTGVKLKAGEFKVTLSWNRVANAHGYVIYYKDMVTGDMVKSDPIKNRNTTTTVIRRLRNNHKYMFVVHAYRYIRGKYYYSKRSAIQYATPYLYTPGKPMLQIGDIDSGKATLTWKNVVGATSYQVFILQANNKYRFLQEVSTNSATITQLKNDTHYTFAVRSVRRVLGQFKVSKADSIEVWVRTLKAQYTDINDQSLYTGVMKRTVTAKRINGPGTVTIQAGTPIGIVGWSTVIQLRNGIKCKVNEDDITRTHNMFDSPRAAYGKQAAEYYVNHRKTAAGKFTNIRYQSSTNFLIWANPYTEHTYIFKRNAQKNWELIYCWNCMTGRYEHQSIYGVWKIVKKKPRMYFPGLYANYACLFTSDGNAFHSIRYTLNGALYDPKNFIGKAASAGCIRLDLEEIQIMYNKIPVGTTVIIH